MERGSYTLSAELKAQIGDSAQQSGMTASSYLETLLSTQLNGGLPHFGIAMLDASGNATYAAAAPVSIAPRQSGAGEKLQRATFTLRGEIKQAITDAATLSGMSASAYLEKYLDAAFPGGLPSFGVTLFSPNGEALKMAS